MTTIDRGRSETGPRRRGHRWTRTSLAMVLAGVLVVTTLSAVGTSTLGASPAAAKTAKRAKTAATAAKPVPVSIGVYAGSFYTWLPYLAAKAGFFAKNGIDANLVSLSNGPVAFSALASSSVDVVDGDVSLAGPFIEKGVGLKVLSGSTDAGWKIVAPQDSKLPGLSKGFPASVRGLKGTSLAVWTLGSSSYYVARYYMTSAGLPANSVTYVAAGGPFQSVAAIQAGQVQAAIEAPDATYLLVKLLHAKMVFDPVAEKAKLPKAEQQLIGRPSGALWARSGWASSNKTAVSRMQLALMETDLWMHQPGNLTKVVSLLQSGTQLPKPVTGATVQPFVKEMLQYVESYYPPSSAQVFSKFWLSQGLLNKKLPVSEQLLASVPATAAAVTARVKAAGNGAAGNGALKPGA